MKHLPIWCDATQLLLEIENAVREFPRYHKYSLGTDLRQQAMGVVRLINRAYHEEGNRKAQVKRLVLNIDDLKVLIQLAKEIQAFSSFKQFQSISEKAVLIGKQSGSWLKKVR